jgi:peptidoglycan/xylan/chitin deacetylase (PgdA/CDA1 family)
MPDIPNWAWHEYGNRVGFWRMLKVIDQVNIPAVLAINGGAIQAYEPIARAALDPSVGIHRAWLRTEEHAEGPRRTAGYSEDHGGDHRIHRPPASRLARPGLTETWDTPDILAEEGYEYVCDWVLDDQPLTMKTRTGSLVSVPYTQECNDVAMMLIQHHKASEYRDRAIDQFEQLYSDAEESARVMALVVHPYIMGVGHRLRYFREALEHIQSRSGVVFWTGEQILDWYLARGFGNRDSGFAERSIRARRAAVR